MSEIDRLFRESVDHARAPVLILNAAQVPIVCTPPPPLWFEQEPDYLLDTMTVDLDVSHGVPVGLG